MEDARGVKMANMEVTVAEKKIDRKRAEGAYVSSSVYVGAAQLILIERVNGDCTVDSVEVTRAEAKAILSGIQRELEYGKRGRYDK